MVRDILTRLVMEEARVRIAALLNERTDADDWRSGLDVAVKFIEALAAGGP